MLIIRGRVGRSSAVLALGLTAASCATTSPIVHQECRSPDAQLARVLQPLETMRANGCEPSAGQPSGTDCDRLQRELERLVLICPGHAPTLMANAVIAYEDRRQTTAQQLLDQILAQPKSYPDAAALRARIAIEEGNLAFAKRLVQQHIMISPDHPGLHETYGAALYVGGQLAEAKRELAVASTLGAPKWRIAYHFGLIEEASGHFDEAARYYSASLEGNPGFALAEARLKALRARS